MDDTLKEHKEKFRRSLKKGLWGDTNDKLQNWYDDTNWK